MPDVPREPPETEYPPTPWRMRGTMAMGIFPVIEPPRIPVELRPVFAQRLAVVVVRYREGTLRYDELVIGSMARHGRRFGLFVHHIWVDDLASLWGGRRHWGLPKQLAEFTWKDRTVEVADEHGKLATISTVPRSPGLPPVMLPLSGFGLLDDSWVFTTSKLRARWGTARMEVTHWSDRFPALARQTTRIGAVAEPFQITVPAPLRLGGGRKGRDDDMLSR